MDFDAPDGDMTGFNMNGEFDGGQFIDGEFYYSSRKSAPTQTKNQQIYGIFDDEEEAPPSFGGRRGNGRLHATADSMLGGGAIQFVSRGVVEPSAPAATEEEIKTEPAVRAPRKPVAKVIEKGFGKFEEHTKGFGMKMLLKMGFKGRLGKNEDGMVNPIMPKLRKQGEALQGVARQDSEAMEHEIAQPRAAAPAEELVYESRAVNWKKSNKRKEKTVYKTAAELLSTEIAMTTAPEKYQIIDHRGPSVKILSGEQISTVQDEAHSWAPTANAHQLPELQHNLKLLVEMTEEDIKKIKREITQTETRFSGLKQSREKVEAGIKREGDSISRVQEALAMVDKCIEEVDNSKGQPVADRLDMIAKALDLIHRRFPAEWERFGLANLAEPQAFPLVKALLHSWEPLDKNQTSQQNRTWMVRLSRWKVILEDDPDVLKRLWEQTLVPIVFIAVSAQWQPRDFAPCVRLLTDLQDLLPEDLFNQIRHSAMIRVKQAVDDWDPRTDTVPVHSWVLPWRDLSPEQEMQPIYEVLQAKLSSVLREWHPSDTSAFAVISPWQDVFLKQNFEALLARSILPKLHAALRSMTVNPAQQHVEPFQWAMTWANLIPSRVLVQLLRLEFFPKWFSALYTWLSRDPNFEEVSQWYMGWRNLVPDVLRDTLDIKQILNRGLDLMRLSINDPKSLASTYAAIEHELKNPASAPATPAQPTGPEKPEKIARTAPPSDPSLSFKEIVQKFADMHGLDFVPNPKRGSVDGKPVFNFGKVAIYLDNRTIFASLQDSTGAWGWTPMGLQDLLERAR